jgi:uncharacterized NAD(P)/FAD-binding protein YdhS
MPFDHCAPGADVIEQRIDDGNTDRKRLSIQTTINYEVVIIGGGFSGTTLATALISALPSGSRLAILEPRAQLGRGVAYSTESPCHLLNVPAKRMSSTEGDPDHFVRWLSLARPEWLLPEGFLPRGLYGQYIEDSFKRAQCYRQSVHSDHIRCRAIGLKQEGSHYRVTCSDGSVIRGRQVVLATGNLSKVSFQAIHKTDGLPYVDSSWEGDALRNIPTRGHIILLGTGLTAIDQVLILARADFRGTITMLSRRGILPAVHQSDAMSSRDWSTQIGKPLRSLVSEFRRELCVAERAGQDWRSIVDSVRPWTSTLWQALSMKERRQFIRHLRTYWEPMRHRMPPEVNGVLQRLLKNGQLRILPARILEVQLSISGRAEISCRDRATTSIIRLEADKVINCVGSVAVINETDALTQDLIKNKLAHLDECAIGFAHSLDGRIIDRDGKPAENLYLVGPQQKAGKWESTAVPEIRAQVKTLAVLMCS